MNPAKVVEHPSCSRVLDAFACLVRKGRSVAFGMHLAFVACSHLLGWQGGVVECIGGQDETTVLVHQRLTGGDPHGERAVELRHDLGRWCVLAWASSLVIAGGGADGALGQEGSLQALRKGRQSLRRIGSTGKSRAAQVLEGFAVLLTRLQPLFVHRTLRLRLARLGVEEHPAGLHSTGGGRHNLIAILLYQWGHRLRIGLGQDSLCFTQGRWDTGDPLRPRFGELLEVLCTREGPVGDKQRGAIRDLSLRQMIGNDLTEVVRVTPIPTEGLHQHGNASLVFDKQVEHHLLEVRALIPTVAAGNVHDMLIGLLMAVVAAIDMQARAIKVSNSRSAVCSTGLTQQSTYDIGPADTSSVLPIAGSSLLWKCCQIRSRLLVGASGCSRASTLQIGRAQLAPAAAAEAQD